MPINKAATRVMLSVVAALTVAAGSIMGAAPATAAPSFASDTVGEGPEILGFQAAFAYPRPDAAPAGSNDWTCRPSADHPRPVVLVHGTWEGAFSTFARLSPALKRAGFCVFTQNYGRTGPFDNGGVLSIVPGLYGVGPTDESTRQLARFIGRVRSSTGAAQVDAIGHSQGGLLIRRYLKFAGGADPSDPARNTIAHVVTLGATNHGTTLGGPGALAATLRDAGVNIEVPTDVLAGAAGYDQIVGSRVVEELNRGGETFPGIDYTAIATRYDQFSTPYAATFLTAGPGATVHNILLQNGCEIDISGHSVMTYSPRAISLVLRALGIRVPVACTAHPWNQDWGLTG